MKKLILLLCLLLAGCCGGSGGNNKNVRVDDKSSNMELVATTDWAKVYRIRLEDGTYLYWSVGNSSRVALSR